MVDRPMMRSRKTCRLNAARRREFFFKTCGITFGDVGEAEHHQGDEPIDQFDGGIIEAEFPLAGVAQGC